MVIKHYLNGTEIDEPIGFDNLKMTMKRGDYHGMSAEVSEQTLEFYGTAADIVRSAYQADLDTEVTYLVTTDDEEMYNGILDLSTYEEQYSDYCSVSCKVGEVGVKTTFNNRAETELALNGENGIDDNAIVAPTTIQTIIQPIPILYTNKWICDKALSSTHSEHLFTILPIFKTSVNEFGEHKLGTVTEISIVTGNSPIPIFATDSDHPKYDAEVRLKGTITIKYASPPSLINEQVTLLVYNKSIILKGGTTSLDYTLNFTDCTKDFYVYILANGGTGGAEDHEVADMPVTVTLSLTTDSYYKTTYLDKTGWGESIKADSIPVIDALDCVCQKMAGIRVKSDWYKADMTNNAYGGGGLRAITTGYKLRNAAKDFIEKDIFVSFKTLIESLDAVDCIGWCFSKESGTTYIRVERWSWFYKTGDPILVINNPNSVKTSIDTSLVISALTIGYEKYVTNDDINSIDSVHAEVTYTSQLTAVQNEKEALCKFVADPYAIELTRRKAIESNLEEYEYDESIFLFEIWHYLEDNMWLNGVLAAGVDAENLLTGTTLNASLSPRRNAERWKGYLFFANKKSDLKFTSGEGNYKGAYRNNSTSNSAATFFDKLYRPADTDGEVIYEEPMDKYVDLPLINEDQSIEYSRGFLRAETIEFTYPLSVAEYKKVKASPYGLIEVDGVLGWIKEFSYSFSDGEATFKLIPKAD